MLSYPIPEAEELLTNKLSAAQQSLRNSEEDLDFLREQVTVRWQENLPHSSACTCDKKACDSSFFFSLPFSGP